MEKHNLKSGLLFVTLGIAIFVFSMSVQEVNAAFPGANGKIVFSDGWGRINSIKADGSERLTLTTTFTNAAPVWSPDGTKIVFLSFRDGNGEIYIMNPDGSRQIRLTNNPASDNWPAWSPDGTKIAFTSDRDGNYEIYVMNADGSGQTRLTNNPMTDYSPSWSPDGTKIAFTRRTSGTSGAIFFMNPDGSGQIPIINTASEIDDCVDWSPDGTRIAFQKLIAIPGSNSYGEIFTANANGTGQLNISNNPANDYCPSWSPDGTKIAFATTRDGGVSEIYIMNADGSGPTNITNTLYPNAFNPDWQPITGPVTPPPQTPGITVVAKSSAKIRSDRGTSASIVSVVQRGAILELLPLCSEIDSTDCNDAALLYTLKDGHYWLKIKWNSLIGFIAEDLVMTVVPENQPERVKKFMTEVFAQPDFITIQSFPIELLLAIAAHESGGTLNNEITSVDSPFSGIMQVHPRTSEANRNCLGSPPKCRQEIGYYTNIKFPFTDLFEISTLTKDDKVFNGKNYINTQYQNTDQGLGNNFFDGLTVLVTKFKSLCPKASEFWTDPETGIIYELTCADIEKIRTVAAYNGFGASGKNYLKDTADALANLSLVFPGTSYINGDKLIEKLRAANSHRKEIKVYSPVELRVSDSLGAVTGLVNGEVKNEIDYAIYDPTTESIGILFPEGVYTYTLTGTATSTYAFTSDSYDGATTTSFSATDIPIVPGEIHQYSVNEAALARGEDGVTLFIDKNGDGIFEKTITVGAELTGDEYRLLIETVVDIDPDTLNRKNGSGVMTAYIELPVGFDIHKIDAKSVTLNGRPANAKPVIIGDYDKDGIPDLMIKFDRGIIIPTLSSEDIVATMTIAGKFIAVDTRLTFQAEDVIKLVQ